MFKLLIMNPYLFIIYYRFPPFLYVILIACVNADTSAKPMSCSIFHFTIGFKSDETMERSMFDQVLCVDKCVDDESFSIIKSLFSMNLFYL